MEDSFQAPIRYFLEVAARQERIHACPSLMVRNFNDAARLPAFPKHKARICD